MKLHQFFFLLFIFFLPSQLGFHFWPSWAFISGIRVDYLSPTIYFTDLILTASFLFWIPPKWKKISKKTKVLFACLLCFSLINILFANLQAVAVISWIRIFELALLAYYAADNFLWIKKHLFWPLAIACIYSVAIGGLQVLLGRTMGGILYWLGERHFTLSTAGIALSSILGRSQLRPYATFPHPNAFAGFLLVSLTLVYWATHKPRPYLFTSIIILIGILISYSQAAWIAILSFGLIFSPTNVVAKITRHALFASIILSLILPVLALSLIDSSLPQFISMRAYLARGSGYIISQSPLLGVGLGGFIPFFQSWQHTASWFFQPVHNIWLLIFAETGIVGLLFALLVGLRAVGTQKPFLIAILMILITGLVDHYWITLHQTQLLLAIMLGLSLHATIAQK